MTWPQPSDDSAALCASIEAFLRRERRSEQPCHRCGELLSDGPTGYDLRPRDGGPPLGWCAPCALILDSERVR